MVSVKPQHVSALAASLTEPVTGVVTSVVAGCTIDTLREEFKTDKIVRCMPNTPASVLEGRLP
jgi:pyrroline-5-carboxylate reductase